MVKNSIFGLTTFACKNFQQHLCKHNFLLELSFSMRFFAHDALCYVFLKLLQDFSIFPAKKLQIVKKVRNRSAVLWEKTRGTEEPQCGAVGLKGLNMFFIMKVIQLVA